MKKHSPTLVLLSGLLCNDFIWKQVSNLLQGEFEIRVFSFQGFDSIEKMARYVLSQTPESFALIGHSMGGRVALEIYRQAPEQVTHMGLFNTGVHPKKDQEVMGRQTLLNLAQKEGMMAVANSWLPPMLGNDKRQDQVLIENLNSMITQHSVLDFEGQIKALLHRPDAQKVLSGISVPTLLLTGDQDQWSPIIQHQFMQQCIPAAHLEILNNVGHMSIIEDPQGVADCIRRWLL